MPMENPVNQDNFVSVDQLNRRGKTYLHDFERTKGRCMLFGNDSGQLQIGTLIGFRVMHDDAFPVVRLDDGSEIVSMGFVLPLWEELMEFLNKQLDGSSDAFWHLARLMNGWQGLRQIGKHIRTGE